MSNQINIIDNDPWQNLRKFTDARIGLGRCGTSLPLNEVLDFKLSHARARDAVLQPMQTVKIQNELKENDIDSISLSSSVIDRSEFLTRPDKGRQLSYESATLLQNHATESDICIVVGDGLSSRAIHENCVPFLTTFHQAIQKSSYKIAPICMVENGRVAIADEIASYFSAKLGIILIGERPGLSSPNSLGIYLTYNPKPGMTDESRNCISNIREGGLSITEGVKKLAYLIEMAFYQKESGVYLKDKMSSDYLPFSDRINQASLN